MDKQKIIVKKKTSPFTCKVCKQVVDPSKAKPQTIETDQAVIYGWDYGHKHNRMLEIINNHAYDVTDID